MRSENLLSPRFGKSLISEESNGAFGIESEAERRLGSRGEDVNA
jgi:hypothetical protein